MSPCNIHSLPLPSFIHFSIHSSASFTFPQHSNEQCSASAVLQSLPWYALHCRWLSSASFILQGKARHGWSRVVLCPAGTLVFKPHTNAPGFCYSIFHILISLCCDFCLLQLSSSLQEPITALVPMAALLGLRWEVAGGIAGGAGGSPV